VGGGGAGGGGMGGGGVVTAWKMKVPLAHCRRPRAWFSDPLG
jgi:hypothetical protein